jgi:hypothetical protein
MASLLLLVPATPTPAVAAAAPGTATVQTGDPAWSGTSVVQFGSTSTAVDAAAQATERIRIASARDAAAHAGALTTGLAPEFAQSNFSVLDCRTTPLASMYAGFVIDHFSYCLTTSVTANYFECQWSVPFFGCIRMREAGHAEFRFTVAGYGWDGTMIDPSDWAASYNQVSFVTLVDDFHNLRGVAGAIPLTVDIECAELSSAQCIRDPNTPAVTKPLDAWMPLTGQSSFFRLLEQPLAGDGLDDVANFAFDFHLTWAGLIPGHGFTGVQTFRCDAAHYLKGERGCVFDNVESAFKALSLSPFSPNYEEALHVYDAFYDSRNTNPPPPDGQFKAIPGNGDSIFPWPLTRAYEGYEPVLVDANHAAAVRTCVQYWGAGYTQGGTLDCDEYPFRSTYQGASTTAWNYSARPILKEHNRSGGGSLGAFYTNQRILNGDPFLVYLTGGGYYSGAPIPDRAPAVGAGLDVTGNEGSGILLGGSVSDLEGPPVTTWSYVAGADVDPGATCSFGDASAPATTFSCTDDGTFTVTLTADDGTNSPVSDSATVHVNNVSPAIENDASSATPPGPDPWSVFRAGTAVPLRVAYSDPGSNDTQTCAVSWDDGSTESVPAADGLCARDHVYTQPGMYTIKATVTDDDGGANSTTTMVVVYDPRGGFSTVGGWLDSPAGALTTDPTATGRLHFTMNPMYGPHDEGPVPSAGKISATLDGAAFSLESTAFDWLVVTADNKVAAKGTATVNGVAGYGFVAYGNADADSIRLVVWPLSAGANPGQATLYDNRPQADYDLDLADPQPLGGGSVQVHQN